MPIEAEGLRAISTAEAAVETDCITVKMDERETTGLEPGDIIATGTPKGVGYAMSPPRFLKKGDTVSVQIQGIGLLQNQVG